MTAPVLFMRIHKTASEALARQIVERLAETAVCPRQFEWEIPEMELAELRRYTFFQGHISPAALAAALPDLRAFTLLREPCERLLSCYFYWKQGAKHADTPFFDKLRDLSLLEFLRSEEPAIRRVTWNTQARLLAGGQFGGTEGLRQNVFGPWLSEADLGAEAIRAVDRYAFVGLAEQYEAALASAYSLLDLGVPPLPERVNVNPCRPPDYGSLLARPDIADALRGLTGADRAVHDAVRQRLKAVRPDIHNAGT